MYQHLAQIKMADELEQAARERRIRAAGSSRPRSIDAVPFKARLRRSVLRLGQGLRGAAAGA